MGSDPPLSEQHKYFMRQIMRHFNIATLLMAGLTLGAVNTTSAAALTDYVGTYDLYYTSATTDLSIAVTMPDGQIYSFELDEVVELVNEKVPYTGADQYVAEAIAAVKSYVPNLPVKLEQKLVSGMTRALYADSRIPTRFTTAKRKRRQTTLQYTSICGTSSCR